MILKYPTRKLILKLRLSGQWMVIPITGLDMEKMRQKIRSNLILEKVLTKDVVIEDDALKSIMMKMLHFIIFRRLIVQLLLLFRRKKKRNKRWMSYRRVRVSTCLRKNVQRILLQQVLVGILVTLIRRRMLLIRRLWKLLLK